MRLVFFLPLRCSQCMMIYSVVLVDDDFALRYVSTAIMYIYIFVALYEWMLLSYGYASAMIVFR